MLSQNKEPITSTLFSFNALALLLLLGIGLCTFRGYGISYDEPVELKMVRWNADYVFKGKEIHYDLKYFGTVFNFFSEGVYQAVRKLPVLSTAVENLAFTRNDHATMQAKIVLKHLVIFLWALVTFFILVKMFALLESDRVAWIAPVVLALMPLYRGHSFMNPKDIPFAMVFTALSFLGVFMLEKFDHWSSQKISFMRFLFPAVGYGILLGLFSGLRIGGFVFLFFLPAVYFLSRGRAALKKSPYFFVFFALLIPLWMITVIACYPSSWGHPVKWFFTIIDRFSHWHHESQQFYNGAFVSSTALPWHYLPTWFGITVPIFTLASFLAGLFFVGRNFAHLEPRKKDLVLFLLLQIFFLPAVIIVRKSTLYDGLRHCLFVLPPTAVIAAYGLTQLFRHFRSKGLRTVLIAAALFSGIVIVRSMLRLYPYEYTYFNGFVGGLSEAHKRFESDYWGTAVTESMIWLDGHAAQDSRIHVAGPADVAKLLARPDFTISMSRYSLSGEVPDPKAAEAGTERPFYYVAMARRNYHHLLKECKVVHSVEREGALLSVVKYCS